MLSKFLPTTLSLRTVLLSLLALPLIASMVSMGIFTSHAISQLQQKEQQRSLQVASIIADHQGSVIDNVTALLASLAILQRFHSGTSAECTAGSSRVVERHKSLPIRITSITRTQADGYMDCSNQGVGVVQPPIWVGDREYFKKLQAAPQAPNLVATQLLTGRVTGTKILYISLVSDEHSKPQERQLLSAGLDLAWIGTLLDGVSLPDGARLDVVNLGGEIIASTGRPRVAQRLDLIDLKAQGSESGVFASAGELVAFAKIRQMDAYVVKTIPMAQAFAEARELALMVVVTLVIVSGLAALLAYTWANTYIVRPITMLSEATTAFSNGHRVVAPENWLLAEFKTLAVSFNSMMTIIDKRTDEFQRSNSELERFAYVVSHDLQEPLRTVNGYVQLLRKRYADKLDDSANEFIEYASDACKRMSNLLAAVLDYSRVTTRRQEPVPVDSDKIMDAVLLNLSGLISSSHAEINIDKPLPSVQAHDVRFAQVIQNLIANSIKFQPPEQCAKVDISARRLDGMIEFSVRDNGIGFEAKDSEKIFNIFHRLNRKEEYPGTGAGLAITKKIVETHGGKIAAYSDGPGTGATFTFTLPASN